MTDLTNDPDFVQSLARGLAVLSCFDKGSEKLTLTEVATRTELTRGTARRFLRTLYALGYVATNQKYYWLTHKVLKFSSNYLATFGLGEAAQTYIQQLTDQSGETSSMAILDESEIVYVARVEKYRVYSNRIEIGTRLPAHSTALGLVLLSGYTDAELDRWLTRNELTRFTEKTVIDKQQFKTRVQEVRELGYALNDGALELGIRSLSVPIRNADDTIIAALNTVTPASLMTSDEMIARFLPLLQDTAKKLKYALQAE